LIGAINELKRDKKLKIENQRKIDILKKKNEEEIDQADLIKKKRTLLNNFREEIKNLKNQFSELNLEENESEKLPIKKTMKRQNKNSISNKTAKTTEMKTSPMNILSKTNPIKTGLVLPKINSIFSKKHKTKH
jgi:hypothetical protein